MPTDGGATRSVPTATCTPHLRAFDAHLRSLMDATPSSHDASKHAAHLRMACNAMRAVLGHPSPNSREAAEREVEALEKEVAEKERLIEEVKANLSTWSSRLREAGDTRVEEVRDVKMENEKN
ncbi:hypothetical protein PPROV_000047700 [Pycnococcus provasolii]|uniref:Mediator of RNA polymerase II transcription subunit 28 n=1 Tax=Pycnococcus provasolii TaxID=41880 RepID=A0A830H6Q0_9CHLO|nr:hypothetical protein PPROV_000047700 [Pycnococcus provasolii]